jgi:hypothetical protein
MADRTFRYWTGKAGYINDVSGHTWQIVLESALAADTVLKVEKMLSERFSSGRKFAYEKRNGTLIRNYATAYVKSYHSLLGDMVERRMRDAISTTASYWYTAWVNAGMPALNKLQHCKVTDEPLQQRATDMIGRQEG